MSIEAIHQAVAFKPNFFLPASFVRMQHADQMQVKKSPRTGGDEAYIQKSSHAQILFFSHSGGLSFTGFVFTAELL